MKVHNRMYVYINIYICISASTSLRTNKAVLRRLLPDINQLIYIVHIRHPVIIHKNRNSNKTDKKKLLPRKENATIWAPLHASEQKESLSEIPRKLIFRIISIAQLRHGTN